MVRVLSVLEQWVSPLKKDKKKRTEGMYDGVWVFADGVCIGVSGPGWVCA